MAVPPIETTFGTFVFTVMWIGVIATVGALWLYVTLSGMKQQRNAPRGR